MARTPTRNYEILQNMHEFLYSKPLQYIQEAIAEIGDKNQVLTEWPVVSFGYRGETYLYIPKQKLGELHSSLKADMDRLIMLKDEIAHEWGYISSYITKVLNSTNKIDDYYALLPSVLHPVLIKMFGATVLPSEVTEEEIQQSLKFNAKGAEFIKNRLLKNLLI